MRALNEISGTAWWDAIDHDVERLYEAIKMKKAYVPSGSGVPEVRAERPVGEGAAE